MRPFEFVRACSLDEALAEVGRPGTRALAGGTGLVDLMKLGVEAPSRLVDLGGLALDAVALSDGVIRIGALASNARIAADPEIRHHCPAVTQALLSGASGQIRNAASLAGNLMQRTRCPYFRSSDWPCNKRAPGSGCPAREGADAHHAVLGTSETCVAVHASDLAVALLACDAVLHLRSLETSRTVQLAAFYLRPGDTPDRETTIAADELITAVDIPLLPRSRTSTYLKLRGRASYEFAAASVAAAAELRDGVVVDLAVALGGLGTVPWRDLDAEQILMGRPLSAAAIDRFCDALLAPARPTAANTYKVDLARGAIRRALRPAA